MGTCTCNLFNAIFGYNHLFGHHGILGSCIKEIINYQVLVLECTTTTLDAAIVLPALSGAIVSGVGQAYHDYGGLALSPKHVVGAFHLLLTFGVWWMVTDVTSQRKAVDTVQNMDESSGGLVHVPKILRMRGISNIVSCVFVVMMYALMVLKPGFVG